MTKPNAHSTTVAHLRKCDRCRQEAARITASKQSRAMTPEQRSGRARRAAAGRWGKGNNE